MTRSKLALAGVLALATAAAHASLFDRGGGLIYDDVLKITWLKDANYAKTSGYDSDGLMNWFSATDWATNLVYHDSLRNIDYSDWRLPTVRPVNGSSFNHDISFDGSTDNGWNNISPNSEMAYMFHVNLGNWSQYDPSGRSRGGSTGIDWGMVNSGPFINLQNYAYWSETEDERNPGIAWNFHTNAGFQSISIAGDHQMYAWAVRSGDVPDAGAVSEPMSLLLLVTGLASLALRQRRRSILPTALRSATSPVIQSRVTATR